MLILAVDTSTQSGSIALSRGETPLGHLAIPRGRPYSSSLLSTAAGLMNGAGVLLRDVELFAVAAGPGSFTGLRVGLTATKAWAEAFSKPIASVSVLEAIAEQGAFGAGAIGQALLAPVLDARRGQIFGGLYAQDPVSGELIEISPAVVASVPEFLEFVSRQPDGRSALFVSPAPEVIRAAVAQSSFETKDVQEVSSVLAPAIGRLGYRKARRGGLVDSVRLDADYVRRSDAELQWKE